MSFNGAIAAIEAKIKEVHTWHENLHPKEPGKFWAFCCVQNLFKPAFGTIAGLGIAGIWPNLDLGL